MDRAILYLDTCVLLDMLRDPTRDDIRIHEHESSKVLLGAITTGKKLEVCIAEQVEREFRQNVEAVQSEAERRLQELERKVEKVDNLASLYGSPGRTDIRHWNGHVKNCRDFAELWVQTSSIIRQSDAIVGRAFRRAMAYRTPARKGSTSSVQDCLVLETCLEHLRMLRVGRRKAFAVFVSSNTKDYASHDRTGIRRDIEDEFRALDLCYAPNLGAARGLLGV